MTYQEFFIQTKCTFRMTEIAKRPDRKEEKNIVHYLCIFSRNGKNFCTYFSHSDTNNTPSPDVVLSDISASLVGLPISYEEFLQQTETAVGEINEYDIYRFVEKQMMYDELKEFLTEKELSTLQKITE